MCIERMQSSVKNEYVIFTELLMNFGTYTGIMYLCLHDFDSLSNSMTLQLNLIEPKKWQSLIKRIDIALVLIFHGYQNARNTPHNKNVWTVRKMNKHDIQLILRNHFRLPDPNRPSGFRKANGILIPMKLELSLNLTFNVEAPCTRMMYDIFIRCRRTSRLLFHLTHMIVRWLARRCSSV